MISTNLSREELNKRYLPQVVSRLEGEYQFLPFIGQDIRQMKKRG